MFIKRNTFRVANSHNNGGLHNENPSMNNLQPPSSHPFHKPQLNELSSRGTRNRLPSKNFSSTRSLNTFVKQQDFQISQYPLLQYFFSGIMIGLSIYLIYSVTGGSNAIPGFNNNIWWQYIISLIPLIFGVIILLVAEVQSVYLSRKNNQVILNKKYLLCFIQNKIYRKFDQINGVFVVKKGTDKINLHNGYYYIVINFVTADSYQILGNLSSYAILQYFQELRTLFTEEQISQRKVIILNKNVF